MQFQTVGWEQILMSVPKNWTMIYEKDTKKSTKEEKGYFGFRDPSGKKLEISFVQIKKKPPKLENVIKDYYKSLKKEKRKIKIRKEATRTVNGHKARYLYWELEKEKVQGYVTVWICEKTNRLLICTNQYLIKNKQLEKSLFLEILSHIQCHPQKAYNYWSAPNLQFFTPTSNFNLVSSRFLIGLTFLNFKSDDMEINSYRVGLADQKIHSEDELPKWFKSYYRKHFPLVPSSYNPQKFEKLLFKKKISAWRSREVTKSRIKLKSQYFETYLWTQAEKNDIYCIIFKLNSKSVDINRKTIEEITKLTIGAN